jgi:hypothetical protein
MSDEISQAFMRGGLTMGCFVAGLFFVRFWRQSGDRLFLFFVAAFWLLAAHWTALAIVNPPVETRHQLFVVRLLAFVALIVGILDKNRRSRAAAGGGE